MICPKPLKPGACVGLIAPSSPVTPDERIRCVRSLESLGFSVKTGQSLCRDDNLFGYLAGRAEDRAKDINCMFADSEVEAVFCVRGGYGSSQILPFLDYDCIRRNPKVFVGYSDVTGIHTVLQRFCGLVTFHGPMVRPNLGGAVGADSSSLAGADSEVLSGAVDYTLQSLYTACGGEKSWVFENPAGEDFWSVAPGRAEGFLTGGNLSVLARSLGTPYAPHTWGKIVFLEDIGESIPRIHMYLTQMLYAGVFRGVQGILLGNFTDCSGGLRSVQELLTEFTKNLGIPVIGNVCSDHRSPMGTLPLGGWCRMQAGEESVPQIEFSTCNISRPVIKW